MRNISSGSTEGRPVWLGLKHDEALRRDPLGLRHVEVVKLYQRGSAAARTNDDVMPVPFGVLQNVIIRPAQLLKRCVGPVASRTLSPFLSSVSVRLKARAPTDAKIILKI
jgi:hypothetical protein